MRKKHCKDDPEYAREILKQHVQLLNYYFEHIFKVYEHLHVEIESLFEDMEINNGKE